MLIKEGANTFMIREYKILAIFAGAAAALIFLLLPSPIWQGSFTANLSMALSYLAGTILSAIAGKSAFWWPPYPMPARRKAPSRA